MTSLSNWLIAGGVFVAWIVAVWLLGRALDVMGGRDEP